MLSALAMVLNVRNTVAAAMSLVVTMISLAVVYVVLDAHLVAALQIMVYAGAIVVVFLFVVMLLNLRHDVFAQRRERLVKAAGVVFALGGGVRVPAARCRNRCRRCRRFPPTSAAYAAVGRALYRDFVLPFEMSSLLLLAAIVGAVVLAKRRIA